MKILITCSGTGSRMGNYTKFTNKALIKIGDKFSIDYIIDNFKNLKNLEFVITLGYYGDFVKQYLSIAYPDLKFSFVNVEKFDGDGSSQGYSILQAKNYLQEPFIFVACDTIIIDNLYSDKDKDYRINSNKIYLYEFNDSTNYTSVKCNKNNILSIHDKGETNYDYIYIGKCQIYDFKKFWDNLNYIYDKDRNNKSLGDVDVYNLMLAENCEFEYKVVENWYDAGTIKIFDQEINKNTNYNVLTKYDESISFLDDKVIKFFHNKSKNVKRVNRIKYLNGLTPKILSYTDNFYSMEKIKSKPVSEIYEYDIIYSLLNWASENLWIKKETPTDFKDTLKKFYYDKTIERIEKSRCLKLVDFKNINGIKIGEIDDLISKVDFNYLCKGKASSFHGDFILDNILIKDNNFLLIDWREDFGGDLENGDIYYDLAKLKHNIYLNHHNLEKNMFDLETVDKNSCTIDIKCNYFLINQLKSFEKFVEEKKLDNTKINILMSIIWINMAPLHEYPLNNFLLNFGKYNLYLYLDKSGSSLICSN